MGSRHAHLAALAGALWLLAFDVVPMAHVVFHDALEAHHHGHSHEHDSHAHGPSLEDEEDKPSPSEHGEGSAAHRDLAAQVPPASIPRVLEAFLTPGSRSLPAYDEEAADARPRTTRARAPPSRIA